MFQRTSGWGGPPRPSIFGTFHGVPPWSAQALEVMKDLAEHNPFARWTIDSLRGAFGLSPLDVWLALGARRAAPAPGWGSQPECRRGGRPNHRSGLSPQRSNPSGLLMTTRFASVALVAFVLV